MNFEMFVIESSMIFAQSGGYSLSSVKTAIGVAGAIAVGFGMVYGIIMIITTVKQRSGGGGGSLDGVVDGLIMAGAPIIIGGAMAAYGLQDLFVAPAW